MNLSHRAVCEDADLPNLDKFSSQTAVTANPRPTSVWAQRVPAPMRHRHSRFVLTGRPTHFSSHGAEKPKKPGVDSGSADRSCVQDTRDRVSPRFESAFATP